MTCFGEKWNVRLATNEYMTRITIRIREFFKRNFYQGTVVRILRRVSCLGGALRSAQRFQLVQCYVLMIYLLKTLTSALLGRTTAVTPS